MLPFPPYRFGNPATMGAGFVGPLDGYSLVYAMSTGRRLLSSWTGNIAKIRSTGAGTPEQDFGAVAGLLDTAGIATFLGADSGVFKTLYDQTGNGHGLSQSSASKQPAYSATGLNSRPTMLFDGIDDGMISVDNIPAQSSWWGYIVTKRSSRTAPVDLWCPVSYPDTAVSYRLWETVFGLQQIGYNNASGASSAIAYSNGVAYAHLLKGTAASTYAKSSAGNVISNANDNSIVGGFKYTVGYRNDASGYFPGHICEIVLGTGTLTSQQETDIFTQLNAFWGTPIP